jgi:hypothetical protein
MQAGVWVLLTDGYGGFFFPLDHDEPARLVRLSDLLSAERIVADYTFYNALDSYPSATLDEECRRCADEARRKL